MEAPEHGCIRKRVYVKSHHSKGDYCEYLKKIKKKK